MRKFLLGALALLAATIPTASMADSYSRLMRVSNYSNSQTIVTVTATNKHGNTYDVLNGLTITPGYNRVFDFDDGEGHSHCVYALTARFANGVTAQRTVDVCQNTEWRIYDLDNTIR